ncbi:MAG: hypothetical protein ACUVWA_02495 [Candidatus Oleimicrobiaceae bacterium]
MPVQHGWLSLQANELGESLPAKYATHAGNSLLWPLNEQHVAWRKRTVTCRVVLIATLGRLFLTRDRRSLLVANGCDPPVVAGLVEFNDPRAFPIISWQTILQKLGKRQQYTTSMLARPMESPRVL